MEFTPILITGIVFLVLYKVIYILATRKERILFVEKLDQLNGISADPASLQAIRSIIGSENGGNTFTALRWGAAAVGAGLGLLIGVLICRSMGYERLYTDVPEIIMGSSFFLFTGFALVVAFAVEYHLRRKKTQE